MQALNQEGMALYLTRRNSEAAARLWHEMLRLLLASSSAPSRPQLYFLSDLTTAAVMQQWPEDRVSAAASVAGQRLPGGGRKSCAGTLSGLPCPSAPQVNWHRNTALLRLAKVVPWGKWR